MKEIKNRIKSISLLVTTLMTVDGWLKSRASDRTNQIIDNAAKQYQERLDKLNEITSYTDLRNDKSMSIYTNINSTYGRVLEYLNKIQENSKRLKTYNEDSENNTSLIDAVQKESLELLDRVSLEIAEFENKSGKELDNVIKSILDSDQTKLLDNVINNYQTYLDTLTTDQKGALAHILFSLTIIYLAWTIFTLYYADKLIIYFELENKYPRLAKIIKYRRTIQHYSIGFNLLLIFLLAGYVAYINILIFNGL